MTVSLTLDRAFFPAAQNDRILKIRSNTASAHRIPRRNQMDPITTCRRDHSCHLRLVKTEVAWILVPSSVSESRWASSIPRESQLCHNKPMDIEYSSRIRVLPQQTEQKACPACQTQQKVSKTRNWSQSTTGQPAISKKWFQGNSMRIVENTQNAPINQNRWNTLMP